MPKITSKDGTSIAYDKTGTGPAIILVDGAFGHRKFGPNPDLAKHLAQHFTVYTYDRRGRGDSGDTHPYSIEREVEDIAALIDNIGTSVFLFGISSGAALALEAANSGLNIDKLAIYEAPFVVDNSRKPLPSNYVSQMNDFVANKQYSKAIRLFMSKGVGVPIIFVYMMQLMPAWKDMKSVANTLPYDTALTAHNQQAKPLNPQQFQSISMPTQVIVGGKSPDWMKNGMRMLADIVPNAQHSILEGQTHIVEAQALAPILIHYFANEGE